MPDDNPLRDAVRRSTHGHLAEHPDATDREITTAIANRMGTHDPSDVFRILNYVRGARREEDAMRGSNNPANDNTPYAPTNVDPSLTGEIAEYRYRTVIEIINPATGQSYTNVVPVNSTIPLTPAQIRADARASWSSLRGPDGRYLTRGDIPAGGLETVYIIGGGRRGA